MRTTRAYLWGFGSAGSLGAASLCLLAFISAIVTFGVRTPQVGPENGSVSLGDGRPSPLRPASPALPSGKTALAAAGVPPAAGAGGGAPRDTPRRTARITEPGRGPAATPPAGSAPVPGPGTTAPEPGTSTPDQPGGGSDGPGQTTPSRPPAGGGGSDAEPSSTPLLPAVVETVTEVTGNVLRETGRTAAEVTAPVAPQLAPPVTEATDGVATTVEDAGQAVSGLLGGRAPAGATP